MDAYRHVPSGDFCEYYDMLVGPDGFECLLTEPEDRNWYRDGRVVIDRLNAQHAELTALRAEVERLREERRWIPVEERLPDDEADIICAYAGFKSFPGYRQGFNWFDDRDQHLAFPPTHWQPLPAPPVEDE